MIGNLSVTHTNTMKMKVNSNYGYFNSFYFYLGWRNVHRAPLTQTDCGDEIFGVSIGNFYIGYYEDGKWCAGFLNDNGCLN
jgi:hypothetical protein